MRLQEIKPQMTFSLTPNNGFAQWIIWIYKNVRNVDYAVETRWTLNGNSTFDNFMNLWNIFCANKN